MRHTSCSDPLLNKSANCVLGEYGDKLLFAEGVVAGLVLTVLKFEGDPV